MALVFGVTLLIIAAGVWLRLRTSARALALGALAIGLLGLGIIGPTIALDTVIVTKKSIYQKTGFWFHPTFKGFDFAGVDHIEIGAVRQRRGEPAQDHWFVYRGSKIQEIDPGDLWANNSDTIVPWIRQLGIKIGQRTGE